MLIHLKIINEFSMNIVVYAGNTYEFKQQSI